MKKAPSFLFAAVSYAGGEELPTFDKAGSYLLYYAMDGRVTRRQYLSVNPKNLEETVKSLKDSGIGSLVTKNFSPRAMAKLREAGIALYTFDGGTEAAARALMAGELKAL